MGLIGLITRSGERAREGGGKATKGDSTPTSWGSTAHSYQLGGTLLGEGHGIQRPARGLSTRSDYTLLGVVGSSEDKCP